MQTFYAGRPDLFFNGNELTAAALSSLRMSVKSTRSLGLGGIRDGDYILDLSSGDMSSRSKIWPGASICSIQTRASALSGFNIILHTDNATTFKRGLQVSKSDYQRLVAFASAQRKSCLSLRIRRGNLAPWMKTAKAELGQKEVAGVAKNDRIVDDYFKASGFWGKDDSGKDNAWCGSFAAFVVKKHGYSPPSKAYRAKSWHGFGSSRTSPTYGSICVKSRTGGGHVGFAVGGNSAGNKLYLLGGNQGDAVNVREYNKSVFTGFYLPNGYDSSFDWLPIYSGLSSASGSES